ncbi:putative zinc-binding protein [Thermococcus litoralis]|nr:putative zinc-binding protein [Thermococcus litoralis]
MVVEMSEEVKMEKLPKFLPSCHKEAENLDIIFTCSGAASVGKIGHEVGVLLTNAGQNARLCCTTAVAAGSEMHLDIGKRARRVIVIDGCPMKCATKVIEKAGIKIDHSFTVTDFGIAKQPTLDISDEDVLKVALAIAEKVGMKLNVKP